MQLNDLKRNTPRSKGKQVGRGGKRGKTAGRGQKGQKAHGGHGIRPNVRDIIKKLPKLRGRGKNSNLSIQTKPTAVNLRNIETAFSAGETVNQETLLAKGLVRKVAGKNPKVKILGTGELTKKLTFEGCFVSKTAEEKITKAGGSIVASSFEQSK